MYLWSGFGDDLMEPPVLYGITSDLARAMRAAEADLEDGRAFICVIEEVRMRISVTGLEEDYAATGKRWNGRRDDSEGVHWRFSSGSADPSRVYRVPESMYPGDLRGLVA